jgi:hypothetical protein
VEGKQGEMTYSEVSKKLREVADQLEKKGGSRSVGPSFLLICQPGIPTLSAFLISTNSANQIVKIEETIFV